MNIVLYRVDERLVHGQIMASWAKYLSIKRIIIVDDQIAKDDFMKQVLTMAAPTGLVVEVLSVEQMAERTTEGVESGENVLVLFQRLSYALALVDTGAPMRELDIGNIGAGPSRKAISKNVFVSPAEKEMIRAMQTKGVHVYLQMLYSDAKTEASSKL